MSPTALLTGVLAKAVLVATLPSAVGIAPAIAMTVEQAYQEMAHRHAGLDPASAGFAREEAACLSRLFELVDLAIVEKAQACIWFQSEGQRGNSPPEYRSRVDALIVRLVALPTPERLRPVQRLLVDAIRDQRAFFESHGQDHRDVYRSRGMHLRNSSRKLHQVYGRLMDLFPNAGQQNFDAFYDHLCVLDLL